MTLGDRSTSVSQLSSTEAWEPPRATKLPRSLSPATPAVLHGGRGTDPGRRQMESAELLHGQVPQIDGPTRRRVRLTESPQYPPPKHTSWLRKLGLPLNILRGGILGPLSIPGGPERGREQSFPVCSQGHCPVAPEMTSLPRRDVLCTSLTGATSVPSQVLG